VRSKYTDESLPDWVGRLVVDVYYVKLMRSKGIDVTMGEDGVNVNDAEQEDDVALGTLVQPMVREVSPLRHGRTWAHMGGHGLTTWAHNMDMV
jgi:hypothetical protein